jgi:hypothetical protein
MNIENEATFEEFASIARLSRDMVITEKIDGTNAQVLVMEDGRVLAGSRTRLITPQDDNFGFARWVEAHADELREKLGIGRHFGEWWGSGIQRGYGLKEKRFSLFNLRRWADVELLDGVSCVPMLYKGEFDTRKIEEVMQSLRLDGSHAAPGFMKPEGVVIYHTKADVMFKKTFEHDDKGKSYGS